MPDNIKKMKELKEKLLGMKEFNVLLRSFQRDINKKKEKIIENILREIYFPLLKNIDGKNKKKNLKKYINAVFANQRVFDKISKNKLLQEKAKNVIEKIFNIISNFTKDLPLEKIKIIFELIICSFNQPKIS
ncbi:MAG: hypothetical protein ACTSO9_16600 [Candidatus Helarchaeota archaeon]